jgi:ElaB/YqjD/DUF883 family membrane-anchored ribosome-binding protein
LSHSSWECCAAVKAKRHNDVDSNVEAPRRIATQKPHKEATRKNHVRVKRDCNCETQTIFKHFNRKGIIMSNDMTGNMKHNGDILAKNAADKAGELAGSLAGSADRALNATQQSMDRTFDSAKHGVNELRDRAESAAGRMSARAGDLADRGMASAREAADTAKGLYNRYSEATCSYVAEKPMRSLLISAAVGAAVTALVMSALQNRR